MPFDMPAIAIMVGCGALLIAFLIVWKTDATTVAAGFLLFALGLFPRPLWQLGGDAEILTDMAPATPTIETYTVAVAAGLGMVVLAGSKIKSHPSHNTMIFVLLFLILTVWSGSPHQWSGVIVIVTAVSAWAIGQAFAAKMHSDTRDLSTGVAVALTAVVSIQLVLALLQLAGVMLPGWLTSGGRLSVSENGRAIGTLGHPANLSKVTFLLMLVLLPLTVSSSMRTRRWSGLGVTVAIVVAVLTVSRANIIAMVATLTAWLIWSPRGLKLGQRIGLLAGVAVVGAIAAPTVIDRFLTDPDGGARPELLAHGLEQIDRAFWSGTGLNSYIEAVAPYDPMTALGFPVHNTLLFVLAEFGAVAALLFFYPFAVMAIRACSASFRRQTSGSPWSRTVVCAIPGFLVILITGWGMAGSQSLVLWFLVSGIFFYRVQMEQFPTKNLSLRPPINAAKPAWS